MQNKNEKFLIDIYFDENKMNVWKEKCIKSSDFISTKIKSKSDAIAVEKNKIRNEKNSNILNLKEDWNLIISEYEKFSSEKDSFSQMFTATISEEIKKFKRLIIALRDHILSQTSNPSGSLSSLGFSNIEDLFDELKLYKTKIPNLQSLLLSFEANIEDFQAFAIRMKNLLIKSTININLVFSNYHTIKKNLLEIIEKLNKYSEGLKNLVKDFSYLLNPSQFPESYNASLIEIKRRIIFNKRLSTDLERLKQIIAKEVVCRRKFIQDYGKYLTHDYVPQLKFSELELKIEINNQDELANLPNLLEEEEENIINSLNNNLFSDYEEILVNFNNNINNTSNNNNENNNMLIQNIINNVYNNNSNNRGSKLRKNSNNEESASISNTANINNNPNNTNNNNSNINVNVNNNINLNSIFSANNEEYIRTLSSKISELEIMIKVKDSEIKKFYTKVDQKDRKIAFLQSEIEKLSGTFDNLNENFLKQINFKEQKLREKSIQCDNLVKLVNAKTFDKLETCPVCKDIALNSLDFQGWSKYVKDYQEKIIEKNKLLDKLEGRYNDLITQTTFIKKTFFNHLNNTIDQKNKELSILKEQYENKLMSLEDVLSQEKARVDKFLAESNKETEAKLNQANSDNSGLISNNENIIINNINSISSSLEEQIKTKDNLINQYESRLRDLSKQTENFSNELKKNLLERDVLKKANEDMKVKENVLTVDVKMKENKIETFKNDIKNLEKIIDSQKKTIAQINEDILNKIRENSSLKCSYDSKVKSLEEMDKSLESLKSNHLETVNEIYKSHQINIDKLNAKLDELTQQLNEKYKIIEEQKLKNQDLILLLEKKMEEIKQLKDNIDRISKSQQELDILRDKMEQIESFNTNENYKLKKKLEELQVSLVEKEKKLQVIFY